MKLKRELGKWDLVLLMINSIIGAGIFGLPSKIFGAVGIYSIPALFVCAFIIFILVLNFAEVASRFRKTGGPYLYTLTTFGRVPAFIIAWLILITRFSTYAALINLAVTYLSHFSPMFSDPFFRVLAISGITFLLTYVNYRGIRSTTLLNNTLAIAKLLPLIVFIVVGFFYIDVDLLYIEQSTPSLSDFSSTILILIFAFTGFEAVLVNTGEIKKPRTSIPFALIISVIFVAGFYALIQLVSIGTLADLASSEKPLTDAAAVFMGPFGALFISAGAIISISGTLNSVMLIGSRLPYALSDEKQLPKVFSSIHKKYASPVFSLLIFAGISLVVSLTGSFIYAVSISVISKVMIFIFVCAALIKLRLKEKTPKKYFRLPYGYAIAVLGILVSVALLSSSKLSEFVDVLYSIIIGIALYGIFKLIQWLKKK
jgi:amino acid transporter